jgi:hypothetical protein
LFLVTGITHKLDQPAPVSRKRWFEAAPSMLTQSRQRSALVALHQAEVANDISCKNCRQFALLTHHGSVPRCLRRIMEGWRQLGNQVPRTC